MHTERWTGIRACLGWQRGHAIALLALCVLAAGGLAYRFRSRPLPVGEQLPVDRAKASAAEEKINPNDASAASLKRLPGIGPAIAERIIQYRSTHSQPAFRVAEDLDDKIKGIGEGLLEEMIPHLSLPQRADTRPAAD